MEHAFFTNEKEEPKPLLIDGEKNWLNCDYGAANLYCLPNDCKK